MDQTPATTPAATAQGPPGESAPAAAPEVLADAPLEEPGFRGRGRLRRRVRFLRKARELAYRDLGGLVFNLHRYGQRNDVLVIAKLTTLTHIDTELRTLEAALEERHPVTILREAGISACPRCAAIHSGDDRFCPNCGLSMSRRVDLPVAGPPAAAPSNGPPGQPSSPAGTLAPTGTGAPSGTLAPSGTQAPTGALAPSGTLAPTGTQAPSGTQAPTGVQPGTGAQPATGTRPPETPRATPPLVSPQGPPATARPAGAPVSGDGAPEKAPDATDRPRPAPAPARPAEPATEQPTQVIRPPASGA